MMNFRRLLNVRVIAGAVAVSIVLLLLTFLWAEWTAPPAPDTSLSLAALTVIPAPTSTVYVLPTATLVLEPPTATFTPPPNTVAIGVYVQIKGTDGQGLRIRSTPGLDGQQLFLGYDSEVFLVKDGPLEKDGYTWWFLVAPYDENRAGWAASDFLTVIPSP
jgi:hypothetical protein